MASVHSGTKMSRTSAAPEIHAAIHFVEKNDTLLLIASTPFSFSKVTLKECVDVDHDLS